MARAGLTYVAMTAATISAAALGYAVIWSYNESATPAVVTLAPPVTALAPPVQEIAPVAAQELKPDIARGSPAASADAAPVSPSVASKQELPREVAPAPVNPPRSADAMPLPLEQRSEKPTTVSAPKEPTTIELAALAALPRSESPALRAAEKPVAAQSAAPISALPRQSEAVAPMPAVTATPKIESRPAPAPPIPEATVQPVNPLTQTAPPLSPKLAAPQTPTTDSPTSPLRPSERGVLESRPTQSAAPPLQAEQRSALVTSQAAAPAFATRMAAPVTPGLPSASPNVVALAPPIAIPEKPPAVSLGIPKSFEPPVKARHPSAPSSSAPPADRPHISVIRGSHRRIVAAHARVPGKQKVAALPSGGAATQTATDAPPIMVLRGPHRPRYALASAPPPAPEPLLTVIRGARPRPLILRPHVQPSALILHIRH